MIPVRDYAAYAANPPPSHTARRGFIASFLRRLGSMSPFARRTSQRLSAQEEAAGRVALLMMQRHSLMIEKETVAAERAEAARQRKRVSSFDRRLRAINAELLKVGG